ncbi:MAG TPA: hypothetical protein VN026_16185 [Bacteroidia bacterium]|jgi:hypothetical protein|nr:hypothetical protein [Bacteroidia bacterium]
MAVYRFRVIIEDNDDVYRDIDIKSVQTFEELHNTIQDAFKFDKKHAASFFVSDDYWRKGLEITLRKEDLPLTPEEIRLKVEPKKLMSETKIAKLIETPHQRFVYVFDENVQWNFLLEMMKITTEDAKAKYPLISKSIGTAPKQYKQLNIIKDEDPADALLAAIMGDGKTKKVEKDDDVEDESEIYKSLKNEGIEESDLAGLEGEEGEDDVAVEGEDDIDADEDARDDFGPMEDHEEDV